MTYQNAMTVDSPSDCFCVLHSKGQGDGALSKQDVFTPCMIKQHFCHLAVYALGQHAWLSCSNPQNHIQLVHKHAETARTSLLVFTGNKHQKKIDQTDVAL